MTLDDVNGLDGMDDEEDDIYTIETAKETAETSHLRTSEQEERHTFVITGEMMSHLLLYARHFCYYR